MDTEEERESSDGEENGEDEEADVDELDPFSEDSDSDPEWQYCNMLVVPSMYIFTGKTKHIDKLIAIFADK